MNEKSGSLERRTSGAGGTMEQGGIDAVARRRLLLKGLGKGTAIVAAATPIKTLAANSSLTKDGFICSISGMQSAVHSKNPNLPTCGTFTPGYYNEVNVRHWPNYNPTTGIATNTVGSKTFTQNSKFNDVFGSGSTEKLIKIMPPGTTSNKDEAHWICALLSAISPPPGYTNPYSPEEVLALYAGPQRAAALAFFKWLEDPAHGGI